MRTTFLPSIHSQYTLVSAGLVGTRIERWRPHKTVALLSFMLLLFGVWQPGWAQEPINRERMSQLFDSLHRRYEQQFNDSYRQFHEQIQIIFDSLQLSFERSLQQAYTDWLLGEGMPEDHRALDTMERGLWDDVSPRVPNKKADTTVLRFGDWMLRIERDPWGNEQFTAQQSKEKPLQRRRKASDRSEDDEPIVRTSFLWIDVGLNNYLNADFGTALSDPYKPLEPMPSKSWVVNLQPVVQQLNLVRRRLFLSYGLAVELNSYRFSSDRVLVPRADSVVLDAGDVPLKKSKLSCEYVGLPVLLRYEISGRDTDKVFHVAAGGFASYLLGARTKIETSEGEKAKTHDDFNLNPFRIGVTARMGYAGWGVFANYSFSRLFKGSMAPQAFPLSLGLALEF